MNRQQSGTSKLAEVSGCGIMFAPRKVLFWIFLVFFIASCETDLKKVILISDKGKFPIESSKDAEIMYSDSAQVVVIIKAPLMNRYDGKDPYLELPEGIDVKFFDSRGEISSTLKAEYAIRYEQSGLMEAIKNVVVVNVKSETLNTEHLIWDEKKDLIYSKEFVKITTQDEIIFGDGFEANQDFTEYKIFNIKGTISIKNND
jgi:LPS export ABC transporter protein LptC